MSNFNKKINLDFDIIKDFLSLSTLVYNLGINLTIIKDSSNNFDLKGLDISKLNLSERRKKQLLEVISESPNAELYKFYDLPSGNQVGITISHIKKRIAFVFRGSNEIVDWLHNFLICKKEVKENCYVHLGFYKSLTSNNLLDNLTNDIKNLSEKFNDYEIFITGHSLGGGLSTLFGYLMSDIIDKNITVITYASPRVGNYEWCNDFNCKKNLRLYRIVNKRDIITAVPYIYFYHVGNYIYIDEENMTFTEFDKFDDKNNIIQSFNPIDHFIENYYENLSKCKWCKDIELI